MLNNTLSSLSLKELRKICSEYSIPLYGSKKTISERIRKKLLYETFTFTKLGREIKIKDYRFDYIFEKIKMENDFYEHELLDEIHRRLRGENSILIDVGGHIGNHTIYFLKVCDFKKSYIFEPRKELIALISENANLNNLKTKVVINKCGIEAISSVEKRLSFEKRKDYNFGTGKIIERPGEINVSTIDNLFCDVGEKISVVKIDVEGLEQNVLAGARETIKKHTPIIAIESQLKTEDLVAHAKARQALSDEVGDNYDIVFCYGADPGPYTYIFVPKVVNP